MSAKIIVDLEGLKRIVRERGEVTLLDEIVQNALDTDATEIQIVITSPATNRVRIVVVDNDPRGFDDLSDAYTMFGESIKRGDPSKRGFMNVGDKLCLAYATEGRITSTSGSVIIEGDTRRAGRTKTDVGTVVDLTFPMSKATMSKLLDRASNYRIPAEDGVKFVVNGEVVPTSEPAHTVSTKLKLYVAVDEDGYSVMRERERTTELHLYDPGVRGAWIHVKGIPVQPVEGLPFSVDVRGRLKSDMKRDQIPPSAFYRIKVALADVLAEKLAHEDLDWARPVMADASDEVVRRIVSIEFGADAMTRSVHDHSANIRATEEGRNLIPTGAYPRAVGDRMREIRAVDPSFAAPSHVEYGATVSGFLDDAIDEADWTRAERRVVEYARELFPQLFYGCKLDVTVYAGKKADCVAAMGRTGNTGHLALVRGDWYDDEVEVLDTIIHEFAHFETHGCNHAPEWGHACCNIAARIAHSDFVPS